MNDARNDRALSKVPEVTLGFWIIKILATTLGETGGDAVTMSHEPAAMRNRHRSIFFGVFVAGRDRAGSGDETSIPTSIGSTIVATTTVGTTMADFADRSLGIGYAGGSSLLLALLIGSLGDLALVGRQRLGATRSRRRGSRSSTGRRSCSRRRSARRSATGWPTTNGFGFGGGALVFGAAHRALTRRALLLHQHLARRLFWVAFILTRPLGATVGDLLDKPHALGGLALSRYYASAVLIAAILALIVILPQRAGAHPSTQATS